MKCDECQQEVCDHNYYIRVMDDSLYCIRCGEEYGPVPELIEKAAKSDFMLAYKATFDKSGGTGFFDAAIEADLRAQVATLTRERDEAREKQAESEHNLLSLNEYYLGRIAELEKAELKLQSVKGGDSMVIRANGTWEWRKV